jgi:hypothetical protein
MVDLASTISHYVKEIVPVRFEVTGEYKVGEVLLGTQSIDDLMDRDLKKGICSKSPGLLLFELNDTWEFEEIEVGGFTGNTTNWTPGNGQSASISTSLDNKTYKNVGALPSNFAGLVTTIKLARTKAKFIKFENKGLLGLGFMQIKKMAKKC